MIGLAVLIVSFLVFAWALRAAKIGSETGAESVHGLTPETVIPVGVIASFGVVVGTYLALVEIAA